MKVTSKKGNLFYVANVRLPTEKAHGIQIMKMCEAFAKQGFNVTLLLPNRSNKLKADPFLHYNIPRIFLVKYLPSFHILQLGRFGFFLQSLVVTIGVFFYLLGKKAKVVYSRDELPLFFLSFFRRDLVFEAHAPRGDIFTRYILGKICGLIVITESLKNFYQKKLAFPPKKILVAHDAVDLSLFQIKETKKECRELLSLPQDKNIAIYAGHLYDWKGVQTLADASLYLRNDSLVVFVGGTSYDLESFTEKNGSKKHLRIEGLKSHQSIPFYLRAADVVVLPNSAKDVVHSFTSPMKLFEYMASGTPIVASKLKAIEEVLDSSSSLLVEPDNPRVLAFAIQTLFLDAKKGTSLAKQAQIDVQDYTWEKRAQSISKFLS